MILMLLVIPLLAYHLWEILKRDDDERTKRLLLPVSRSLTFRADRSAARSNQVYPFSLSGSVFTESLIAGTPPLFA